jgi:hypothetical protein
MNLSDYPAGRCHSPTESFRPRECRSGTTSNCSRLGADGSAPGQDATARRWRSCISLRPRPVLRLVLDLECANCLPRHYSEGCRRRATGGRRNVTAGYCSWPERSAHPNCARRGRMECGAGRARAPVTIPIRSRLRSAIRAPRPSGRPGRGAALPLGGANRSALRLFRSHVQHYGTICMVPFFRAHSVNYSLVSNAFWTVCRNCCAR